MSLDRVIVSYRNDPRHGILTRRVQNHGFSSVKHMEVYDVYTLSTPLSADGVKTGTSLLYNPVLQEVVLNQARSPSSFDWAIDVGFLPGVTDNEGQTAEELLRDSFGGKANDTRVFFSQHFFVEGTLSKEEIQKLAEGLYNPVIQRAKIKTREEFQREKGFEVHAPFVKMHEKQKADTVNLEVSDEALLEIGKKGVFDVQANGQKSFRGPLALDLDSMKVIREYFRKKGRNPTDVELESLAQTWSEHCKHTIFAAELGNVKEGLYKQYIQRATNEIRARKGKDDFCVSVFVDNSGGIIFDENWIVTDKVETHNSPSALDPFGGAITGIVGVNRDAIGFGKGAKPIVNRYGFCFASPFEESPLFRGSDFSQKMLSPQRIMEGVVAGVNSGGNCSGIPTPQGFVLFDPRYKGKPLVFVGTTGLIPRKIKGQDSWEKQAQPGDQIVMAGGKVGLDGVHGATFSSEAMDAGSPATAVQIGDPITQKKLSDAIVKEARDLELYTSITDNGAGGLSCSVAEMARECNGCRVELDKVPVKYAGMSPWQIWISESQERMTLAVPKEKIGAFQSLMRSRGVESTIIGEFTDSGKCEVTFRGEKVMDIELDFLHDGLPQKSLLVKEKANVFSESVFPKKENHSSDLVALLSRLNVCSKEFISKQFDHEVQGTSIIKPIQGKGRVQGNYAVVRPLLDSRKGIAFGQGVFPFYSDIDTYWMAAAGIDLAVRTAICACSDPKRLALLDNFCWCSSNEPERLWELERAARACYDFSTAYQAPFISGKDSMFNDFKGFDAQNKAVKISVPPTLLVSSIGIVEDISKCISMDVKSEGDLVYVIGETKPELGGSEYERMFREQNGQSGIGKNVPRLDDPKKEWASYENLARAIQNEWVTAAYPLEYGGLGVGLAKMSMAGRLGMNIDGGAFSMPAHEMLFSESLGRILVTISPENKANFEHILGHSVHPLGKVEGTTLLIRQNQSERVRVGVDEMLSAYKKTLGEF